MAFTKQQKTEMLNQYKDWLNNSQAVVLLEYKGMTMKDIDTLRARIREAGGEVHVVKNTLLELAITAAGMDQPKQEILEGSTAVGFAFNDAPAIAKTLSDATAKSEIFKIKGGFLGKQVVGADQIKALAELPPLPVMRARILGLLNTPASQLVRTIAEPARSMASVVRAYSEKQPAEAAA